MWRSTKRASPSRFRRPPESRRRSAVAAALVAAAICLALGFGHAAPALAGEPRILNARVLKIGERSYEFQVTVKHFDDSWDHYLDRWEIVGPDGKVIGTRIFNHPHIGEDYFTRSLRGVTVPDGVEHVIIRVHDKLHGYGAEKLMSLPTAAAPDTGWK